MEILKGDLNDTENFVLFFILSFKFHAMYYKLHNWRSIIKKFNFHITMGSKEHVYIKKNSDNLHNISNFVVSKFKIRFLEIKLNLAKDLKELSSKF